MTVALELAERGRGKTSPNPMVGAVIVKNGRVVGRGYHKKAGTAHAEIVALKDAGKAARGATMYVTLEPCSHFGRTGPCALALIEAGIKKVHYAIKDPNPLVNGRGSAMLRKGGVETNAGPLRAEASRLNEIYLKYVTTGRPFVTLKLAISLDGRIATSTGDASWISGTESRRMVHRLRAESDAVVVGTGTVHADNPELTVRMIKGRNPYRIILSAHPDFKRTLKLLRNNDDARTIVATSKKAATKVTGKNLTVWSLKKTREGIDLDDFVEKAGQFGIRSMLVEGGGKLATSFLRAGLVDKLMLFTAPMIIGKGKSGVDDLHVVNIAEAIRFDEYAFTPSGVDMLFTGYPKGK